MRNNRAQLAAIAAASAIMVFATRSVNGGTEPGAAQSAASESSRPLAAVIEPKHTVLLVHEVLNDFVSEGGAFDKRGRRVDVTGIMQPMVQLIAAARAKNVRVAYVRWTAHPDGSTSNIRQTGGRRPAGPGMTIEGTWGWENPEAIKPVGDDWVIKKYRPDAFFGTPLDAFLRWNAISTIVVVGIGAEVGLVPTVMTASNLGYTTVAVSDAIRPTEPKRIDDAMRLIATQSIVKTTKEVVDIWGQSAPRVVPTDPPPSPASSSLPTSPAPQAPRPGPRFEEILNPKTTALLVHDMINDYIAPGGALDKRGRRYDPAAIAKIVEPMAKLVAAARARDVRIVHLRTTTLADGSAGQPPTVQQVQPAAGVDGSPGWQNIDALKPLPGDWIIRKTRPDAFFASPLDAFLRWNGITTIVAVGINGDIGIIPTLMHANNLGYFRVAVGDCILPSDPARSQDTMTYLGDHATVRPHNDVIAVWAKR